MRPEVFWVLLGVIIILGVMMIAAAILAMGGCGEDELTEQPALWRVEIWNILRRHRVELQFENTCILGRSSAAVSNGIYPVELDNTVSREHCMFCDQDGVLLVWNLSAVNPTVLNGYRLNMPQRVTPGDRLELGSSVFLITAVDRQ